jgi:pimeloyl-ACP methyl ester carboxylesterase
VVKPGEKPPPFSELKAMFAYDTSEPFNFRAPPNLVVTRFGVRMQGIVFQSGGELAGGFLVQPEGEGPFPVVIYAPGLWTDVDMWQKDAAAMAKKGYAGLLLSEPLVFHEFSSSALIAGQISYVIQERRALDLLATMPEIDSAHVGFVGWSMGAFVGCLVAGLEDRIKAYAFVGVSRMTTFAVPGERKVFAEEGVPLGAAAFNRWAARISVIDDVAYLAHNRDAAFLFINGDEDINAMHDVKAFLAAAPSGATWKVFSGGHEVNATVRKYVDAWMVKNL